MLLPFNNDRMRRSFVCWLYPVYLMGSPGEAVLHKAAEIFLGSE